MLVLLGKRALGQHTAQVKKAAKAFPLDTPIAPIFHVGEKKQLCVLTISSTILQL